MVTTGTNYLDAVLEGRQRDHAGFRLWPDRLCFDEFIELHRRICFYDNGKANVSADRAPANIFFSSCIFLHSSNDGKMPCLMRVNPSSAVVGRPEVIRFIWTRYCISFPSFCDKRSAGSLQLGSGLCYLREYLLQMRPVCLAH